MKNNQEHKQNLKLVFIAMVIGLFTGIIVSFYRFVIHEIEALLLYTSNLVNTNVVYIFILLIVLVILGLIVGKLVAYKPLSSGSGIPQVDAELRGEINQNPIRVLFVKITGGVLSALAGLSIGREGPSIQMGAMIGKLISKLFNQNKTKERFFLTSGASAGLASAFNAPLAGVLFALEEMHRYFNRKLLLVVFSAAIVADYVSKVIFGTDSVFNFGNINTLPVEKYYLLFGFSIIIAVLGFAYFKLMQLFQNLNTKINFKYKMVIYFVVPIVFFMYYPLLLGGGGNLFKSLSIIDSISILSILFFIKLVYSIFSFSSKVPGGIFFPILILGALIGNIFGKLTGNEFTTLFIIFGMAGYLTAIVRAPITSIVLLLEMSGNITYLLPLSIVCFSVYIMLNYFDVEPIYEYLLKRLLKNNTHYQRENGVVEIVLIVENNSAIINHTVQDLGLHKKSYISKIVRNNEVVIINGSFEFSVDDQVFFIIKQDYFSKITNDLKQKFKGR